MHVWKDQSVFILIYDSGNRFTNESLIVNARLRLFGVHVCESFNSAVVTVALTIAVLRALEFSFLTEVKNCFYENIKVSSGIFFSNKDHTDHNSAYSWCFLFSSLAICFMYMSISTL